MVKKNIKPLTKEQQRLIDDYLSDNYKKVKQCIHITVRRPLSVEELEDYIEIAHLALVKAAKRYNANKNVKFSTFAGMNITSAIKTYMTHENRQCRKGNKNTKSYDEIDENGLSLKELLTDGKEINIQEYNRINKYVATLSKDAKKVLFLLLQGQPLHKLRDKTGFDTRYLRELLLQLQNEERVNILKYENRKIKGRREI